MNNKDYFEFKLVGIVVVILGITLNILAIVLGLLIETSFFFLLIPGTCYMINSTIVLVLNRRWNKNDLIID